MGPLTLEEVQHIATLCRIGVTGQELEEMRGQLSRIFEMFQVLQRLDTEGVPATGYSASLETVMRPDEPAGSLPSEDVLANAPQREGDLFRVKLVVCLPNEFTIRQRSTWPPGLPPLPMGED